MQTRQLILVKHAQTLLTPEVTAEGWPLSPAGRAQCLPLAERLAGKQPARVVASTELKAIETGQIIARQLKIPFETALGLHEHDRSNVPLVPRERFEEQMRQFFESPHEIVYGLESADEAYDRFHIAVVKVLREHPAGTLALVTHATVMALLLARNNGRAAFELWRGLASPSFALVDAATFALREIVPAIA